MDVAEFERIFSEYHPDGEPAEDGATVGPEAKQESEAEAADQDASTDGDKTAVEADGENGGESSGEVEAVAEVVPEGGDDIAHLPDRERAQVRAARYAERQAVKAERQAVEERDRLARENEELRRRVQAAKLEPEDEPYTPDPVVLEQLKDVDPRAAKELEDAARLRAENVRLKAEQARAKPAQESEPEFEADSVPDPDLAAALKATPALDDWRLDPKAQADWNRAKAIDGYLSNHPDWAGKPIAERFAEVVRIRRDEVKRATTPQKATVEDARRVIAAKAKEAPMSVTDVRGRTPPTQPTSSRAAWKGMTNDELISSMLN